MRRPGGARRGLGLWLAQRASAVYLAIALPVLLARALAAAPLDYAAWRGVFMPLPVKVGGLLAVGALLIHAWIGLREVFIDYVHPLWLRLALYGLSASLYLGCMVWAADILWGLR